MSGRARKDPADALALTGVERSVTVGTAAALLSLDDASIRRLLHQGQLRGHRAGPKGGGVRVFATSITEYQQANLIGPGTGTPATKPARPRQRTPAHGEALATLAGLGCIIPPAPAGACAGKTGARRR